MRRELERYLWDRITGDVSVNPRAVIREMWLSGMIESPKQAWRTLEKWCDRGYYDFGVCLDLGWPASDRKSDPPLD